MKKYFLLIGGVLLFAVALSGTTFAQTTNNNQYPTKPADAATINDIQGQVGRSYFQDNSLKQGAGNVSEGGGTGNLLKNTDGTQVVVVTGPVPTEDNAGSNQKNIPWVGLIIFALVIVAPLVIIFNMIKDLRTQNPVVEGASNNSDDDIEVEEMIATEVETTEDTEEEVEATEEEVVNEDNEAESTEKPEEKPITATKTTVNKKSKKGKKKKRR